MFTNIFGGAVFEANTGQAPGVTTRPINLPNGLTPDSGDDPPEAAQLARLTAAPDKGKKPPRVCDLAPGERAALLARCPGLDQIGAPLEKLLAWTDHVLPDPLLPLAGHDRWYVWKWTPNGANKPGKPPLQAAAGMRYAANNNPDDWRSYKLAKQYVDSGLAHGVGIAITGSSLCAFDMDDCFDADGELLPSARQLVERCHSYTEWTPSRNGLRIIGTADLAKSGRRGTTKTMLDGWKLEIYEAGCTRFITISGKPFEDYCVPVRDLGDIFAPYFAPRADGVEHLDDYKPDDNDVDWARFCSAVRAIPNDGTAKGVENFDRGLYRDVWVPLGACIYRTGHPDAGKLFLEFSKKSPRHRMHETRRVWRTFDKNPTPTGGRVWTPATIYWIAQQNGWTDPNLGPPLVERVTPVTDDELIALYPVLVEVMS